MTKEVRKDDRVQLKVSSSSLTLIFILFFGFIAYYHECFLRGKPFLAARIQRQKIKGAGARRPAAPKDEPKFYKMKPLPPSDFSKYKVADQNAKVTVSVPNTLITGLLPEMARPAPSNVLSYVTEAQPNLLSNQDRGTMLSAMRVTPPLSPHTGLFGPLSRGTQVHNINQGRSYEEVLISLTKNQLQIEKILQNNRMGSSVFTQTGAGFSQRASQLRQLPFLP